MTCAPWAAAATFVLVGASNTELAVCSLHGAIELVLVVLRFPFSRSSVFVTGGEVALLGASRFHVGRSYTCGVRQTSNGQVLTAQRFGRKAKRSAGETRS